MINDPRSPLWSSGKQHVALCLLPPHTAKRKKKEKKGLTLPTCFPHAHNLANSFTNLHKRKNKHTQKNNHHQIHITRQKN